VPTPDQCISHFHAQFQVAADPPTRAMVSGPRGKSGIAHSKTGQTLCLTRLIVILTVRDAHAWRKSLRFGVSGEGQLPNQRDQITPRCMNESPKKSYMIVSAGP
jgi:hypothetical protein